MIFDDLLMTKLWMMMVRVSLKSAGDLNAGLKIVVLAIIDNDNDDDDDDDDDDDFDG